jgi:hypothetical protein|nr:MAG TPA: cell division suppressor protein [Caudoviricetes sp.]
MNRVQVVAVAVLITLSIGVVANSTDDKLVEYRKEIASGDTLWDVCAKVASDKDNLQELVYNTMKENRISDPGSLQPGEEIIIRVKAVK